MDYVKIIKKEEFEKFMQEFKKAHICLGKSQVYMRLLKSGISENQLNAWFNDVKQVLHIEDIQVMYEEQIPGLKERVEELAQFYQRQGRKECLQCLYDLGMDMQEILNLLSLTKLDVLMIADLAEVLQECENKKGLMN